MRADAFSIFRKNSKHWDKQGCANSAKSDQTAPKGSTLFAIPSACGSHYRPENQAVLF